jgi:hypothetical protein
MDVRVEKRRRLTRFSLVSLTVLVAALAMAVGASLAQASYNSFWHGKVNNGVQLEDREPPWEHGNYHLWTYADLEHPGTAVKELCILMWTGSEWESGGKCEYNQQILTAGFPGDNALGIAQGWATSGSLTLEAGASG